MKIFDILESKTDDELIELLLSAPLDVLIFVKLEWNRRHPEDKIPV